ncbi:MAG: response regulator [Abditibacteriales bacterium]|nr:response regulator [Abditibacteriales bacterium]MDW8367340.1 response regulator [Abditibacteriales bacterium]
MSETQRILLVDDSLDGLVALARLLKRHGYEVTPVTSAEEALKALDQSLFNLLITDWRLPGMDGLTLAQRAQAKCPHLKVLTLTAYEDFYNKARLRRMTSVDAHLTKPVDPRLLLALLTDLLSHHRPH